MAEAWARCRGLLEEETSDEEKFAGLLLATKLLDPSDPAALSSLCDCLPFAFLRRMLLTGPSRSEIPVEMLHSIAVYIISSLCSVEDLAGREGTTSTISPLARILLEEEPVQADILKAFWGMSRHPAGRRHLLANDVLATLATLADRGRVAGQEDMTFLLSTAQNLFLEGPPLFDHHLQSLVLLLMPLSRFFQENQGPFKFQLLTFFSSAAGYLQQEFLRVPASLKERRRMLGASPGASLAWAEHVRRGLVDLIRSRIGPENREAVFALTSRLASLLGSGWFFGELMGLVPAQEFDSPKFVSLMTHLVCVELRIILEDQKPHSIPEAKQTVLAVGFQILEAVLEHLSALPEKADLGQLHLSAEAVLQVQQALQITFGTLFDFLLAASTEAIGEGQEDLLHHHVVLASIKLIALWFAGDPEASRKNCQALIPLFIAACLKADEETQAGLLDRLLPVFHNTVTEEKGRMIFVERGGCALLGGFLCSPSLRALLGPHSPPQPDLIQPMLYAAEVLTTLLSQEPKVVIEQRATLAPLLEHTSHLLPPLRKMISENGTQPVALFANLCYLSCLVLRGVQDHLDGTQPDLGSLVDGCLYFITLGLGCRSGRTAEAKALWEAVSELWFLTLAAFGDCLEFLGSRCPKGQRAEILAVARQIPKESPLEEDQRYQAHFHRMVSRLSER